MNGRRTTMPVAVVFAVVGGLLLVGATSAEWVRVEAVREVGGVSLPDARGTPGVELAPSAVPAGLLGALAGLVLSLARRRGRRPVGMLLTVTGVIAGVLVSRGVAAALTDAGALTPAPWLAVLGAATLVAAGFMALRRPTSAPALGSRYSLEGSAGAEDDEWGLASDE